MTLKRYFFIFMCVATLPACGNQYWYRGDSISLNHGDAVRSNIAVQVPDPWPKNSDNTNIPMDPVKAQYAIECYRLGKKPSDSLGPFNMAYGMGGRGSGGSDTSCQETGAKPTAPQGTENLNIQRQNNETGNLAPTKEEGAPSKQ